MFESKEAKDLSKAIEGYIGSNWDAWDGNNRSKFINQEFIVAMEIWRGQNTPKSLMGKMKKVSQNIHFGREVVDDFGTIKLAKVINDPDDFNAGDILKEIDFENELVIWLVWEDDAGFLLTNKAMYCSFKGEKLSDQNKRLYVKDLSALKSIEIKKSLVFSNVVINDEFLGDWPISDGKKFIRGLCESIFARATELASHSDREYLQDPINNVQEKSNISKIKELKELLDIGAISKEEFESKKNELMTGI